MTTLRQPLKWHGGKGDLATRIVALFPPRCANPNAPAADDAGWLHYVEPYAGGLAVLLANDPEGISEVVNDLNGELTNFWSMLKSVDYFQLVLRALEATPFSESAWEESHRKTKNTIGRACYERAADFFIACRQSLAGRMQGFSGVSRTRTRGGMNGEVSAWLSCIEGLPAVHARLKRVLILNRPALDVIKAHDGPRTLFYLDPPYLHETRATTGEYAHEMTDRDHAELLLCLDGIKGRFLLSGYHSTLYDNHAKTRGWTCHEFDIANNAAGGKEKRRMVECLWANFGVEA